MLAGLLAGVLVCAPGASAATPPNVHAGSAYVPNEVIVTYKPSATRAARAAAQRESGAHAPKVFAPYTRVLKIRDGESVDQTIAELERQPGVLRAVPNLIARASFVPNDPGQPGSPPGGWQGVQWNFSPEVGVNAPAAWDRLNAVGRPGGQRRQGRRARHRRRLREPRAASSARPTCSTASSRATTSSTTTPTPTTSTATARTSPARSPRRPATAFGVTGLAYGARIMPVRVLDRAGTGDSVAISAGIRYAARKGAKVINLSFEFDSSVTRGQIPDILDALRYARRKGVLVIGASGNFSAHAVAYPARATHVLSVGATTEHLCQADYSNSGSRRSTSPPRAAALDAEVPGDPNCRPGAEPAGRDIYQVTYAGRSRRDFGLPSGYIGTSMAAPHVSATAALIIASGVIGPNPTPAQVEQRLKATARDLGTPGADARYGAGLVDAARAVTP